MTDTILTATSTIRTELRRISSDLDAVLAMCEERSKKCPTLELKDLDPEPVPTESCEAYAKILGTDTIYCKHCHKEQPLSRFLGTIKKYIEKGVLGLRPIKTCDVMIAINDRQNEYSNPVNNTKTAIKRYTSLRDAALVTGADTTALDHKLAELQIKLDDATKRLNEWRLTTKH